MRYLLFGVIGVVALVVGAAAIGPAFVDWNRYKDDIAAEVHGATGRTLEINGDLAMSLLPAPRLSASDVRLTARPGSGRSDMARLGALRVHIRLVPLLRGQIRVTSMTLVDPVVVFEVAKDGGNNWDTPGAAAGVPAPEGAKPGDGGAVSLDSLRIENGTFIYRDLASGVERKLDRIGANVSAASLTGPFVIEGDLATGGKPVAFEATIGSLATGGPAPVDLTASVADDTETKAVFKGRLSDPRTAPRLSGALTANSSDLAGLVAVATGTKTGPVIWRGQRFALETKLEASAGAAALNDMTLDFAGTRATGGLSIGLDGKTQVDVALKVRNLDIDKLRQGFTAAQARGKKPGGKKPGGKKAGPAGLALPKDLGGSIDLEVASATWMSRQMRGLKLAAVMKQGEITISRAGGRFPGGAEATASGFVSAKKGQPVFEGKVRGRANNLRETLNWLKIDVTGVSRDRLRKLVLSAKVRADARQLYVTDLDATLDATKIKGGVTYALTDRPSFGASAVIDKLNLDAYMPAAPPPGEAGNGAAARGGQTATGAAPLAFLNDFDANLALRFGSLTYRQTPIRGARLNGTLFRGKLTIRDAGVTSLGGTRIGVKGTLEGFKGFPAFKGSFDAAAKDPAGLFRVLGITPLNGAGKLGAFKLTGKADTDAKRLTVDTRLDMTGGRLTVAGSVADYRDKPVLDLTVNANHPDIARLAAVFGVDAPKATAAAARLKITATVKGPPEALALKTNVAALGGRASVAGTVTSPVATQGFDVTGFDVTIDARHPDVIALMRAVAPDYRPAGKKIGGFAVAGRVHGNPTKMTLEKIRAAVGAAKISGSGAVDLTGTRPSVTAALTVSDLMLDPLLPPDETPKAPSGKNGKTPKGAKAASNGAFSHESLDLAALGEMDAAVTLDAKSITHGKLRIDDARIVAALADRVLTVTKAEGGMFGGTVSVIGSLSGAGTPALEGKVTLRKANVKKALFEAAGIDLASGMLDLDLDVKGAGRSEHDLVAALSGAGKVNASNGVVKGFDLPAVSKRLKKLKKPTDILSLFSAGMGRGSTRFSRLDGTFRIEGGVVRTTDTKLVAESGEGAATGTVDLPKWTIRMDTTFRLTDHPEAPSFGMKLRGPLDEPRRIFEFQDLQAYLMRLNVNRLIQKVLPTTRQPAASPSPKAAPSKKSTPTPAPRPKQPTKKINPDDILKGLLQGLQQR